MCGFASFSTKRHWSQIRAIGLDHELPEWNLSGHLPHAGTVLESHDPGERDQVIKIENLIGLLDCAAETMKDAAQFSRVWAHDFERVVPGIALMDNDVESEFHSKVELLFKQTGLFRLVGAVVSAVLD